MILYFLLGRRATPGPSPVMAEVFRRLTARGFRVESGIAESALIRTDDLAPGYNTGNDAPFYTPAENRFPRDGQLHEPAFILTGEKPRPGENPRKALGRILPSDRFG